MISSNLADYSNQIWLQNPGCQYKQHDCCCIERDTASELDKNGYYAGPGYCNKSQYSHKTDECTFILSMNELLVKYSQHLTADCTLVTSGGVQQLMNRMAMPVDTQKGNSQPRKGTGSEITTFHDLPVRIKDVSFSFCCPFLFQLMQ